MVILIPYHNPCDYQVFLDNHLKALEIMRGYGYRCITLEAVEAGTTTKIPPQPEGDYMSWVSRSLIWHKERLINLGARRLLASANPPDKIMWLDSGCYLDQDACVACEQKLDVVDITQAFNQVLWYDHKGGIERQSPSAVYILKNRLRGFGAPGGAWASRARFFKRLGLYDRMIVGGGDTFFYHSIARHAFCNIPLARMAKLHMLKWNNASLPHNFTVDYVPGELHHLWHMEQRQRGHETRLNILVKGGFNPMVHLAAGPNELYRWAVGGHVFHQRMMQEVTAYMQGRHIQTVPSALERTK